MRIRKTELPADSLTRRFLPADYTDAFACEVVGAGDLSADEIQAASWTRMPVWVNALFKLRNGMARLAGLKGGSLKERTALLEAAIRGGGSVDTISVPVKSDHETVLRLSDKHLDALMSVHIARTDGIQTVTAITVVHFHNLLGRVYFFFIRPLHKPVVKSMLKNTLQKMSAELSITIRPEKTEEFDTIYTLIQTAFKTAKVKDGTEQDYAAGLRNGPGYLPELALVAEINGGLVGHIMFTRMYIERENDRTEALLLSPISVLPEHRNRGIGSALIRQGFERAGRMGYKAVFLVGDPAYYSRFGFRLVRDTGIRFSPDMPPEYADHSMVCELETGFLETARGVISIC